MEPWHNCLACEKRASNSACYGAFRERRANPRSKMPPDSLSLEALQLYLMQSWEIHENHVASLYQMLGYTVQTNVQVSGKQVDLICEKWIPGAGKTLLYIDAKHTMKGNQASVSVQDVEQFISSFESHRAKEGWTGGVLVSNKPFTQFAKALALTHGGVYLKTIEDLYEDALAIRPYLQHAVDAYSREEIHGT